MSLTGLDAVMANLRRVAQNAPAALGQALYQEALAVDAKAVELCPVDTGRLRATHYAAPPVVEGSQVSCEIGFGTGYAVYVHEMTELHHPVGQAKFLQAALDDRAAGFAERLAKRAGNLAKAAE